MKKAYIVIALSIVVYLIVRYVLPIEGFILELLTTVLIFVTIYIFSRIFTHFSGK